MVTRGSSRDRAVGRLGTGPGVGDPAPVAAATPASANRFKWSAHQHATGGGSRQTQQSRVELREACRVSVAHVRQRGSSQESAPSGITPGFAGLRQVPSWLSFPWEIGQKGNNIPSN